MIERIHRDALLRRVTAVAAVDGFVAFQQQADPCQTQVGVLQNCLKAAKSG